MEQPPGKPLEEREKQREQFVYHQALTLYGLPDGTSWQDIDERSDDEVRKEIAHLLEIPETTPWTEISRYQLLDKLLITGEDPVSHGARLFRFAALVCSDKNAGESMREGERKSFLHYRLMLNETTPVRIIYEKALQLSNQLGAAPEHQRRQEAKHCGLDLSTPWSKIACVLRIFPPPPGKPRGCRS